MQAFRRGVFALVIGLGGVALLVGLGLWQTQRLFEKQAALAALEARQALEPLFVEGDETLTEHNYRRAVADGAYAGDGPVARYLTSMKPFGPGYRVIYPFELRRGGRVLVDAGYIRIDADIPTPPEGPQGLTGVLHWPQERGAFTPEPRLSENLFFAREVAQMAAALDAAPVMIVLEQNESRTPIAIPPEIKLPNSHLVYAITWYSLSLVWAGMTVFYLRRRPKTAAAAT